jgi:hypothetical protein
MGLWTELWGFWDTQPGDLSRRRFSFTEVRGRTVGVQLGPLGAHLVGVRYQPVVAPAVWRRRVGRYRLIPREGDYQFMSGVVLSLGEQVQLLLRPITMSTPLAISTEQISGLCTIGRTDARARAARGGRSGGVSVSRRSAELDRRQMSTAPDGANPQPELDAAPTTQLCGRTLRRLGLERKALSRFEARPVACWSDPRSGYFAAPPESRTTNRRGTSSLVRAAAATLCWKG